MPNQVVRGNDLEVLTKLNDDYIQSVQHSNVKRFDEILVRRFPVLDPTAR